jgi:hypothetical protein
MEAMKTDVPSHLEIEPWRIGELDLGVLTVALIDLEGEPFLHTHLRVDETEYVYDRSYPVKGHSAVMPGYVGELRQKGRRVLIAERNQRYYVYVAS